MAEGRMQKGIEVRHRCASFAYSLPCIAVGHSAAILHKNGSSYPLDNPSARTILHASQIHRDGKLVIDRVVMRLVPPGMLSLSPSLRLLAHHNRHARLQLRAPNSWQCSWWSAARRRRPVYLFAGNTTGFGSPSISLLNAATTGLSDALGAYVLSASDGSFSITGDYTCTPNSQVYIYAAGGNPGYGVNSALSLMAPLGNCPGTGNFLIANPFVSVNEITTVAMATAVGGYAFDPTHISSGGTPDGITGIANAFLNTTNYQSDHRSAPHDHPRRQRHCSQHRDQHAWKYPFELRQLDRTAIQRLFQPLRRGGIPRRFNPR